MNLNLNVPLYTHRAPTPGPWMLTDNGKIVPHNYKHEELEWIADIQTAPLGNRNMQILLAASLMFEALKQIRNDPVSKRLGDKAKEALLEAMSAAE